MITIFDNDSKSSLLWRLSLIVGTEQWFKKQHPVLSDMDPIGAGSTALFFEKLCFEFLQKMSGQILEHAEA